jgi:class 3 adenylate cyclase/tetratricopeptide (TPR) repeat protein
MEKFLSDLYSDEAEDTPSAFSMEALQALRPHLHRFLLPNLLKELTDPNQEPRQLRRNLSAGLNQLQKVYNLLCLYIPTNLRDWVQQNPTPGTTHGEMLAGTILFADVSGFTALTEHLSGQGQWGVEEMIEQVINPYLKSMLEVLGRFGGDLLKFAGDAVLAYFPAARREHLAPTWAVRAALSMQEEMRRFENIPIAGEQFTLRMKVGIESGRFLAASVGTPRRMEYVVMGRPVRGAMWAESSAGPKQVVVGPETHRLLEESPRRQPLGPDLYLITEPGKADDFEMRAHSRRPRRSSIVSKEPAALFAAIQQTLQELEAIAPYLAPELVSKVVTYASERGIPSELRQGAAVMFVNLLGLDELLDSEHFDPAAVTAILQETFVALHREVDDRGGVISRIDPYNRGSKLLVLFGAPQAHEDDPLRAVDTALAMRRAVHEINSKLLPPPEPDRPEHALQLRAGITYGPTIAGEAGDFRGRREYTVMGDEVNLSARLMGNVSLPHYMMDTASAGEIYINQSVQRQVAGYFAYESKPPIRVKGKTSPIPIYAVRGRAELIGRQEELTVLKESVEQTLKGKGRILSITGPPGSGAKRLSAEAGELGRANQMRLCRGRCLPFASSVPYAPWIEALSQGLGFTSADDEEARWEKLKTVLGGLKMESETWPLAQLLGLSIGRRGLTLAPQVQEEQPPDREARPTVDLFGLTSTRAEEARQPEDARISQLGVFARLRDVDIDYSGIISARKVRRRLTMQSRERIFSAVNRLVRYWAREKPLLLIFEDFHLADDTSLDLLMRVAGGVMSAPILIVLTTQAIEEGFPWEKLPGCKRLPLDPLSPQDSLKLAAHFLGRDEVPAAIADLVGEKAQGNPLFIIQLVSSVEIDEKGEIVELPPVSASDTLDELILSRIDRLGDATREVLSNAAVVDGPFNYGLIRELCPTTTMPDTLLAQTLEELCSYKWLVRQGELEIEYTIADDKVREVAYKTLPFRVRRDMHGKVAAYLLDKADESTQAERLAFHYARSDNPAKAIPYLLRAARTARQRGAYPEAERLLENCLQIIEKSHPKDRAEKQAETLEELGDVLALAGRHEEADAAYRRSLEVESERNEALVQAKRGLLAPLLGRDAEGIALLAAAWPGLEEAQDWQISLAACAALVWLAGQEGREADKDLWWQRGQSLPVPDELPEGEEIEGAIATLHEIINYDETHPGSYAALWPSLSGVCFWNR